MKPDARGERHQSRARRKLGWLGDSVRKRTSAVTKPWAEFRDKISIARTGTVRSLGNRFDFRHPRMTNEIRAALQKGRYEWREIGMIERHVRPDDRVIELGACLGATSMVLYDTVGPERLLVFEADPRNLELARRNFEINGKDVRCENAVLWSGDDRPDTVQFGSHENPSSSSLLPREGNCVSFDVPTRSFEEVLRDHRATALVLDIEGGEIDLLNHAASMHKLRLILMEAHERIVGEEANRCMIANLEARGFEVVENLSWKYIVLRRHET